MAAKRKAKSATLNKHKIIRALEAHKAEIGGMGARNIALFGSYAKGSHHKRSDIDILVSFKKKTFDNYMD